MADRNEHFFISLLKKIVVGILVMWAFIWFLSWDEETRAEGATFILPYELFYEYEGEDLGYEKAKYWKIKFDISAVNDDKKTCETITSFYNYELLLAIKGNYKNNNLRFAPVWVWESNITGALKCDFIDIGNLVKQPSMEIIQKHNTKTRGLQAIKKFKKLQEQG